MHVLLVSSDIHMTNIAPAPKQPISTLSEQNCLMRLLSFELSTFHLCQSCMELSVARYGYQHTGMCAQNPNFRRNLHGPSQAGGTL